MTEGPRCVGCGRVVTKAVALTYGGMTGVYRCEGGFCSEQTAFVRKGVYRSPGSSIERTDAETFVVGKLTEFLGDDTPYRVGVLLLTYASEDPTKTTSIAGGAAMAKVDLASAVDFVQMIKRLRGLADELEALAEGKAPLPLVGGGDG